MEKWEAAYIAGIIDGEGSITLTRMHVKEHRKPCITITSNDIELLEYVQRLTGGSIYLKKNYNINRHQNSYILNINKKKDVFKVLTVIHAFLRIDRKGKRAEWILNHYNHVTPRNGKYSEETLKKKILFEKEFFKF